MVWLYRAKAGIVGQQGAIAVRLKVDQEEFTTGWFVETMVLESHRGKAMGPMLVRKAMLTTRQVLRLSMPKGNLSFPGCGTRW